MTAKQDAPRGADDDILEENSETALYNALLQCKTPEECRAFMVDLCTPQERGALAERWVIARLLNRGGMSYRDISAATGASTTTIGRVARFLQQEPHQGYKLVLERLNNDRSKSSD